MFPVVSLGAIPKSIRPMLDCGGKVAVVRRVNRMVEQVEPIPMALYVPFPFGAFGELPKGLPRAAYATVEEANPTKLDN